MAEKAIRLGGESTADAIVSAVDAMYTEHTFAEKDFALKHNEDEIIVPSEDDVDEELLTSAFKPSAADVLRKAKEQGFVTPTSEYVGVPAA